MVGKAKLRAGQQVLIPGCLGSVGRVAAQIARLRGAEVVGSCSAAGFDEARALGVREVVDYRGFNPDDYRGRFDAVYDVQGKFSIRQCGAMLKRGGVALHNVPKLWNMFWSLLSPRHKIVFAQLTPEFMAGISAAAAQGKLPPKIGRTVGLSEAILALVELEKTGLPKGKLIIVPHAVSVGSRSRQTGRGELHLRGTPLDRGTTPVRDAVGFAGLAARGFFRRDAGNGVSAGMIVVRSDIIRSIIVATSGRSPAFSQRW